jgi:hypothetical protein
MPKIDQSKRPPMDPRQQLEARLAKVTLRAAAVRAVEARKRAHEQRVAEWEALAPQERLTFLADLADRHSVRAAIVFADEMGADYRALLALPEVA